MTQQLQFPAAVPGTVNPAAGERAKTTGMAQAEAATAPDWAAACQAAIRRLAATGAPFQAADLLPLCGEPDHPNRWGPQLAAAARAGIIRAAGYAPSKRATVRSSACRQWIGAAAGRDAA